MSFTTNKKKIVITKVTKVAADGSIEAVDQFLPVTQIDNVYVDESLTTTLKEDLKAHPSTYIPEAKEDAPGLMSAADKQAINDLVTDSGKYELKSNKVSVWSQSPSNDHYPTEQLVKDEIDGLNNALTHKVDLIKDSDQVSAINIGRIKTDEVVFKNKAGSGTTTLSRNDKGSLYFGEQIDDNKIILGKDFDATKKAATDAKATAEGVQTTVNNFEAQGGKPGGWVPLNSESLPKIPSQYLPSYVDDVLEYASLAQFPKGGTEQAKKEREGKIYVALDSNKTYRYVASSDSYVEISATLEIGVHEGEAYSGLQGAKDAAAIKDLQPKMDTLSADLEEQKGKINSLDNLVDSQNTKIAEHAKRITDAEKKLSNVVSDIAVWTATSAEAKRISDENARKLTTIDDENKTNTATLEGWKDNGVLKTDLAEYVNTVTTSGSGNGVASITKNGKTITVTKTNFLVASNIADRVTGPTSSTEGSIAHFKGSDGKAIEGTDKVLINNNAIKIEGGAGVSVEYGANKIHYKESGVDKKINLKYTSVIRKTPTDPEKEVQYTGGSYVNLPTQAEDLNVGDFFFATFVA